WLHVCACVSLCVGVCVHLCKWWECTYLYSPTKTFISWWKDAHDGGEKKVTVAVAAIRWRLRKDNAMKTGAGNKN
ncbi:hypothetical protein WUBG_05581, partial [Wuchereria bancrofti]